MTQIIAHLIGDYVFQTHWMAINKTKKIWIAVLHASTYTIPFIFITQTPKPLLIILITHAIIDRFQIAKYLSMVKNWHFEGNGYPEPTPIWLSTWLIIILDNTLHLTINFIALTLY